MTNATTRFKSALSMSNATGDPVIQDTHGLGITVKLHVTAPVRVKSTLQKQRQKMDRRRSLLSYIKNPLQKHSAFDCPFWHMLFVSDGFNAKTLIDEKSLNSLIGTTHTRHIFVESTVKSSTLLSNLQPTMRAIRDSYRIGKKSPLVKVWRALSFHAAHNYFPSNLQPQMIEFCEHLLIHINRSFMASSNAIFDKDYVESDKGYGRSPMASQEMHDVMITGNDGKFVERILHDEIAQEHINSDIRTTERMKGCKRDKTESLSLTSFSKGTGHYSTRKQPFSVNGTYQKTGEWKGTKPD